jgi:hypothetical protein
MMNTMTKMMATAGVVIVIALAAYDVVSPAGAFWAGYKVGHGVGCAETRFNEHSTQTQR